MKRPTHIGLDISGNTLSAVQLTPNGDSFSVVEAACVRKLDCNESVSQGDAKRAMDLIENRRFRGHRIVSAVPCELQLLGSFEIPPPDSGADISEITRGELAHESKLKTTDIESDWWVLPPTGKTGDSTRAIAVGLSQDKGRLLVDTLVEEGFEPVAFDVRGLAILRACRHMLAGSGKISSFVEIGDFATLTCVCIDDTIIYYRRVEEGLDNILQDVMREMNVDALVAEEMLSSLATGSDNVSSSARDLLALVNTQVGELAQTVRAAITYASHRYPHAELGNVLLMGAGADVLDVTSIFEDRIGIPVRRVTLGDVCRDTRHSLHSKSVLVPAAGMAMYGEVA